MKVYGQNTASKQLGADKMILNGLTTAELQRVFGTNGRYASLFAYVFDTVSKSFFYLSTLNTLSDALDTANWVQVPAGDIKALMWTARSYQQGSLVMHLDQSNLANFYFSIVATTAQDVPEESNKWFKILADSNVQSDIPRQSTYITAAVSDESMFTYEVDVDDAVSIAGNRMPIVTIRAIMAETDMWSEIRPEYIFKRRANNRMYIEVKFTGSTQSIKSTTNNVLVTML